MSWEAPGPGTPRPLPPPKPQPPHLHSMELKDHFSVPPKSPVLRGRHADSLYLFCAPWGEGPILVTWFWPAFPFHGSGAMDEVTRGGVTP